VFLFDFLSEKWRKKPRKQFFAQVYHGTLKIFAESFLNFGRKSDSFLNLGGGGGVAPPP